MSTFTERLTTSPVGSLVAPIGAAVGAHRRSLAWLVPLLAVGGAVSFTNLAGAPQRIDDEGTYTAQAWAIIHLHQLAHYTYWYDHPPLGWIQLALYAEVTGAFARHAIAVVAMREAMVLLSLVSAILLWALVRRLGFSRPASTAAGLVFLLSPLALQFHRTVYLDNVATPWLLAALVLVLAKRAQLAAYSGAALCFGIAVLSKETYLLAFPLLAFFAIRGAHRETRRYSLSVAGSILVLVGGGYLLLALVKGELLPHAGQVSLLTGVMFQLGTRASSGSLFDPASSVSQTASVWWQLDPVLIVVGLLAAVAALFLPRMRAWGIFLLATTAFLLRPGGYAPVPFVIMLIPVACIVIMGVGDHSITAIREHRRRIAAIAGAVALGGATLIWAPLAVIQLRGFLLSDLDAPMVDAESWIGENIPTSDRLVVDDAMWVDLVNQGRPRSEVVWYYKVDTDPAVEKQSPDGWRDTDYVITTNSMRTFPDAFPRVQEAIDNSVVVARFGTGTRRVEVRQVLPQGLTAGTASIAATTKQAAADGAALATNPGLHAPASALAALRGGTVDERIILALGAQLAQGDVTVAGFARTDGVITPTRRDVAITRIGSDAAIRGGRETTAAKELVASLGAGFAPSSVSVSGDALILHYDLAPASASAASD